MPSLIRFRKNAPLDLSYTLSPAPGNLKFSFLAFLHRRRRRWELLRGNSRHFFRTQVHKVDDNVVGPVIAPNAKKPCWR